jgi:para-aminobenzoate synthetase / 4-amino-4-deoxychorismate lyase
MIDSDSSQIVVLLEDSRDPGGVSHLFRQPLAVIRCDHPEELNRGLDRLEGALDDGFYLAGFLSYEVGYLLEKRLRPQLPVNRRWPLFWFGVFPRVATLDGLELRRLWRDWTKGRTARLGRLRPGVNARGYRIGVRRIQEALAAGEVYQVNYTFPMTGRLEGDPCVVHARLRKAQPVSHGAFIAAPDFCISSHSPELFLRKRGEELVAKPMKGTAPRGRTLEEDEEFRTRLERDAKSQAENLMIVDLLRNDLSRIARVGGVRVDKLFEVETFPGVLQMTSTIRAEIDADIRLRRLLEATFPCGSVTGAPKLRAMEMIREIEESPRGVYCGAIGMIAPNRDLSFNVPIRTLTITRDGEAAFGTGSGVVADSEAGAERAEALLKAAFLRSGSLLPDLIETLRWERAAGFWLLAEHLERLRRSALYFGYPCDPDEVARRLGAWAERLDPECAWRVRLLLRPGGAISLSSRRLSPRPSDDAAAPVAFASRPVNSGDRFLFHKTTRRRRYDWALRRALARGHWDVLFLNERGEVTEGARSNIFVEKGGVFLTPPLASGLLPGTFRAHLMTSEAQRVRERVLYPGDLRRAERIYLGNALHGLVPVRLDEPAEP